MTIKIKKMTLAAIKADGVIGLETVEVYGNMKPSLENAKEILQGQGVTFEKISILDIQITTKKIELPYEILKELVELPEAIEEEKK